MPLEVRAEFFGYGVMGVTAVHHDGVQLYSRRFTASKTCWVRASIFVCVYFCLCRPLRGLPVCPLLPGQNSPEMGVGFLATRFVTPSLRVSQTERPASTTPCLYIQ